MGGNNREHEGDGNEEAPEQESHYRPAVGGFRFHEPLRINIAAAFVNCKAVKERRHDCKRYDHRNQVLHEAAKIRKQLLHERFQQRARCHHKGDEHDAVQKNTYEIGRQQLVPVALFSCRRIAGPLHLVKAPEHPIRHFLLQEDTCGPGKLDHVRSHRIYEIPHYSKGHADACNDESEFTQLRQAETGMHGIVEAVPGE